MVYKSGDKPKKLGFPWMTKDGYLDLTKLPIDVIEAQAVSDDGEKFRSACRILGLMASAGRIEAEVFLYGLLSYFAGDTARKQSVIEALGHVPTRKSAESLFSELEKTTSSNSTRSYIDSVLRAFRSFPLDLVEGGFRRMLSDRRWSYKMKRKFMEFLDDAEFRHQKPARSWSDDEQD